MRLAGIVVIVLLATPILAATGNWKVSWENVKTETDGCFFFSGPDGRDDKLVGEASIVRDGDLLAIHFGKVVFRGRTTPQGFTVSRKSEHDFNGSWNVTEVISGKRLESPIRAHYRYNECQVGDAECPGQCTINGTIVFKR